MINPINIFYLTRIDKDASLEDFNQYLHILSNSNTSLKNRERKSLYKLVDLLLKYDVSIDDLDGFTVSYSIPQIAKEFDLLKIGIGSVLNIELKSEPIELDKIASQLKRNKYYLKHLSALPILLTYESQTDRWYTLDTNDNCVEIACREAKKRISSFGNYFSDNTDSHFSPSSYLVSPINQCDAFLRKEYFLTSQQEEFKRNISKQLANNKMVKLTGGAGTGKTLLLYDIARDFAESNGNTCVIHSGNLASGHYVINQHMADKMDIISAKQAPSTDLSRYKALFIDEAHRLYAHTLNQIIEIHGTHQIGVVFSLDSRQSLSKTEIRSNNEGRIDKFVPSDLHYSLTNKIRTNRELASFIRAMLDLRRKNDLIRPCPVKVLYAKSTDEARLVIQNLRKHNFTYISLTNSKYTASVFDELTILGCQNTHAVIGQEFDNVVVAISKSFFYDDENALQATFHPNKNYLSIRLLFESVTRVRNNLAIVVVDNCDVFSKLVTLLDGND
ncbi:hypothetical protein DMP06_07520 [Slackia equolifaciens]|uniref:Schlafen group 3-like DNA/RNA helicase domain-containing protein n=1 Tax=Slackia equolifaciens TaxID=498718 RepID=A0A3N0AXY1_9ACTN|nr:DNA/RNA helicase domain-containing protein [Slackia equolifaciens]RNL39460.1 hypothetical protein DMP06_07520 [Slackia equolifaciens]